MRAALTRDNVRAGLVGGVIVLYLALVGMIERFQDRDVITEVIGLGTLLILIGLAGTGYMASRPPKPRPGQQPSVANPAFKGLVAGAAAGALAAAVILVLELLIAVGADVRSVLASVTPGMLSTVEFGLGPFGGAAILIGLGAALGAGAGALRLLSDHIRDVVTFTVTSLLLMSLLEPILGAVLDGLSLPERWLYQGGGLTVLGAILTVILAGVGRWFWKQREPQRKEAVALMPADRRTLYRKLAVFAAVALLVVLPWIVGSFISDVLGTVGLYVLLGLGLNIVVGYAGLLDLGYVAFFAVGAYATGVLTSPASYLVREEGQLFAEKGFTNFWLALPLVVIIAVIIGVLIGAPVLRLRGDYLAIVTLGFGEIIRTLVLSDWLSPYLGGAQGLLNVPPAPPAGLDLRAPQNVYYLILVFCGIATFVAWRLSDSRVGRAWAAIREDESVAEAMGVSVIRYKLLAFAMGAGVGSLGGVFFAAKIGSIFPNSFGLLVSINVLSVIILGGLGSIPGVIVGSAVLVGLPELLREFAEFRLLIYGGILVAIMILRPEGLVPNKRRQRELHARDAEVELAAIVAEENLVSHLLELDGVSKRFGGVQAVDDVDFYADDGEIVGVIGPNGAGKTTLFNIVTGFYSPDAGKIRFDGHNLVGLKPNQITKVGIARTFQAVRLFGAMTVLENAMVGQHPRTRSGVFGALFHTNFTKSEEERVQAEAGAALDFFGDRLSPRLNSLASELAYADRRRLEIARAMATEPQLLLLDEPAAGMNPAEKDGLIELIGRLRDEKGYSIVLIEHDMPVISGVSDRVVALDYGKKIAEGTYDEVAANQQVIEAYLGKSATQGQT